MRRIKRYFLVVVGLMLSVSIFAQTTKWRDIYMVKKKDTIFGIASSYGLSLPELMDANPEMKQEGYMLQKGATLFIPYAKGQKNPNQKTTAATPAASQKTVAPAAAKPAATVSNAVKIGVMLPLHDVDGDGKRMVEYYRGILMACDYLKKHGVSTDVHAWNVPIDADIRTTCCRRVPASATLSSVRFIPSRWLHFPSSARTMASSSSFLSLSVGMTWSAARRFSRFIRVRRV